MTRLAAILDSISAVYRQAHGLTAAITYEPRAVQAPPLVYSLLDSFTRTETAAQSETRYRILSRVVIQWRDTETAEQALMEYADTLPALIAADPQLGGLISRGRAHVTDAITGFLLIDGTECRVLDLFVEVMDKVAHT
jgi:hypothetical protein